MEANQETGIERKPPMAALTNADVMPSEFTRVEESLRGPAPLPMRKQVSGFKCLRDQVLVRPCEREEMDESNTIWLPKTGQERPMEGIVEAVGRGRFDLLGRFWPCEAQVGERVLYGRYSGDEVMVNGVTCKLMREEEIKGVIQTKSSE